MLQVRVGTFTETAKKIFTEIRQEVILSVEPIPKIKGISSTVVMFVDSSALSTQAKTPLVWI